MSDLWFDLPNWAQDTIVLVALLLPALIVGLVVTRGLNPSPLVRALLARFRWTNAIFIVLISISVGLGIGLLAQERGLREGTARAAEPFRLVVTAPGSEITAMFATVYLEPTAMPLLDGEAYTEIAAAEGVDFAAPLGFGDSHEGAPVVGTIAPMVTHLAGDREIEGRSFERGFEAVAGALVDLAVGDSFTPAHGIGAEATGDAHEGVEIEVVGRMPRTGTPWDRAVLIPIETVWETHGLPNGQSEEQIDQIGPPYDPAVFPGTPAIVVNSANLPTYYGLQAEFNQRSDLMAFFPGAVLSRLYSTLGDVREVLSLITGVTQALLALAVLSALLILTRLFRRQLALLRALGSPRRFVFSIVWSYAATLIVGGTLAGLVLGVAAAEVISGVISQRTDIAIAAAIGWREVHLSAALISAGTVLALLPGFAVLRMPVIEALRT